MGPGSYRQEHKTLVADAKSAKRRASRINVAFGTTTAQRGKSNIYAGDSPDPGTYELMLPRTK